MVLGVAGNRCLDLDERLRPGRGRSCPVCRWQGRRFRTFVSPEIVIPASICPVCGSFDRHRHLVLGMREVLADRDRVPRTLLGLSLSPAMIYLLAHEGLGRCFKSDYDRRDPRHEPEVIADLARAGFAEAAFDWVVCSHVLEHVPDLDPAVDELLRVLRPGGLAWIQVAYHADLAESRRIPLDPHDFDAHAWRFGADVEQRLARPGWTVVCERADALSGELRRRHGIHPVERYWLARKHP
jgi:SAM-dependent methyltransferase